ncbi:MAG: tetratricopeptide repeat protein [Terracidiphilus sp.]|jgi:tetratricopeptide (TPR) repeat protein
MCRFDKHRWLPAMIVLAALATTSPGAFTQAPAQAPENVSPSQVPGAAGQFAPTPEQLGDSLMTHQRYQAAIEDYKKGPRDSADLWNKMGIAYQMMFNMEEAGRCYQESLKLNPRNARVLNNLATLYDSLKQYGAAERLYRKALKLDPQSALIYKNLGTNLLTRHKYQKGWEVYKTALSLDPQIFEHSASPRVENPASIQDRGAMNYYMARGCVRAGMNDQAIEYLRMALNEGFTNPKKIVADSEFASLRGLPAFDQLLAAQGVQ